MPLELRSLVTRLQALKEYQQRIQVLSEVAESSPPDEFVATLHSALDAIGEGDPVPRLLIDVFHAAVDAGKISYGCREALYVEAAAVGAGDVQRIILAPPPKEIAEARRDPPGSLAASGESLGRRKWLARRAKGDMLDRLLLDPDSTVVSNLLHNPQLTEEDVVRLVARRPNYPEVIAEVARSPRWNRRYSVRRAIVFNPYTPIELSLRQIPFLSRQDLLAVATDGKLHQEVTQSAQNLSQKRPPVKLL